VKKFASSVIPDDELEEYLKDKLLVKPDYGYSTEAEMTISSHEVAAREAEERAKGINPKRR